MSKKGGTQTSTQTQDPWSGIADQLKQAVGDTQNLYNSGGLNYQAYSGPTVADQSPYTQQANQLTADRALNGSPVTSASQQQITDTLSGKYLDPSTAPGFQQALTDVQKAYSTGTAAQTDAAFNRSGAYGGTAYDETKEMQNKAYGDSLNTLAGNFYNQGRTQQLQAAALAPQIANQDYTNLAALSGAGTSQDAYNQSLIDSNVDKYNTNQQAPANAIQNYISLLNGSGAQYGSTTKATPYKTNTLGPLLGLAGTVGGAAIGGPAGAKAGGALGGAAGGKSSGAGISPTSGLPMDGTWSDIRLKDNISQVGEKNGFPIYNFSYIADPKKTMYRGVMAQDVIKSRPDAIEKIGDFMAVKYDALGIEFKKIN